MRWWVSVLPGTGRETAAAGGGGGNSPHAMSNSGRVPSVGLAATTPPVRGGLLVALLIAMPVAAQDTMPPAPYAYRQLADPAREASAQALMETLRCLQCQGQSIADSDAPIAGAMRSLVRQRIAAGETPEHIRAWLIERYGDYISYRPPLGRATWPLYAAPLALVAVAGVLLRRRFGGGA